MLNFRRVSHTQSFILLSQAKSLGELKGFSLNSAMPIHHASQVAFVVDHVLNALQPTIGWSHFQTWDFETTRGLYTWLTFPTKTNPRAGKTPQKKQGKNHHPRQLLGLFFQPLVACFFWCLVVCYIPRILTRDFNISWLRYIICLFGIFWEQGSLRGLISC